MGTYINNKTLLIIASPKSILFYLPIVVKKSLKHEIKFIISCNECLAEYTIKNKISQLLFKYKHENNFMSMQNSSVKLFIRNNCYLLFIKSYLLKCLIYYKTMLSYC